MKKNILIITASALLCGCSKPTATPQSDPRLEKIEAKLSALETNIAIIQNQLDSSVIARRPAESVSRATVSRVVSGDLDTPPQAPVQNVTVVNISGRVTEQNSTWWKWSYLLVVANTNEAPIHFNATIQFLDKDGFVLDEDNEYDLSLGAKLTNRITGYKLITSLPASQVKNLKVISAVK